ncbi:MAG: hypothetical protein JO099_13615 [Acidobacteriia bacterium]|nr:hypothetical protein [Terriglobia bacterium]
MVKSGIGLARAPVDKSELIVTNSALANGIRSKHIEGVQVGPFCIFEVTKALLRGAQRLSCIQKTLAGHRSQLAKASGAAHPVLLRVSIQAPAIPLLREGEITDAIKTLVSAT